MMETAKTIYAVIEIFFLVYLIVYTAFLVSSVTVGAVSLYEMKRRASLYNSIHHDFYIPISVIVPAFNEQLTIVDTVNSLLNLDYRLFEIIVVDDGSRDDTARMLIEAFDMKMTRRPIRRRIKCKAETAVYVTYEYKVPITLISKENGGKADALNLGINASEYPYVVCMDADSMLQHDALRNIARTAMENKNVIAVGGLVRIVNDVVVENGRVVDYRLPKKLILCMQVIEYDRSFLASRLLFDKFNGNLIISGAFGLFRKDILIGIGGYDSTTVGEDMEVIVRMHAFARANKIPYRIGYAPDAVCWSQAPGSLTDLMKQRRRWHIGLFESISRHRQALFNPVYGLLSYISFIYYIIYELLSPYIELFGLISMALASAIGLINVPYMLMFMGIYVVFNSLMALTAFNSRIHAMSIKLRWSDRLKALFVSLLENVGMRTVLAYTRFTALIGHKKKRSEWGSIMRYTHMKRHKQMSAEVENENS